MEAVALLEYTTDEQQNTSSFDASYPWAACRLCGEVFQPTLALHNPYDPVVWQERREWTWEHARTHDREEHIRLRDSGKVLTAEAQERLARVGVFVPGA